MNNKHSVRQIRLGQALAGETRCDIQHLWAEQGNGGYETFTWDMHGRQVKQLITEHKIQACLTTKW